MALKKNVKLENGIEIKDAYIKVTSVGGDKEWTTAHVGYFVDKEQKYPVKENAYVFTPDVSENAKNIYKQAYEYLKSHSDFAGAEDVLEDGQHA